MALPSERISGEEGIYMRKLTAKLLTASIVALGVIVLASPVEVLAKKKVKTEKVTIIKGRNQCFTFRKLKLKKIKVKYSKKKIATARMKKGTDQGAYIRIDGKKLGQTTITVKAYFSNKKCKTFKYKVKVTTYLQIANSATAKKKAKKAFALQNKYRKQAGAKELEWSDEMYEYGLYRLKTSGYDRHENKNRDSNSYFGDLAAIMYVEKDCHWLNENLASYYYLTSAVKAWKNSPGHYRTMIEDCWMCGAIVQYNDIQIAVFSSSTANEMKEWRNYKSKYAKVVIKRQNALTGAFLPGSEISIYDKADKWNTMRTCSIMKASGLVLYVKAGRDYGIFESMVPNGSQKAQRIEFTAMPLTEGCNEFIMK